MMKYFSFIIKPVIKKLFQTKNEETLDFISANITCNILSLGSAATPFGIEAMKNLEKENKNKGKESKDMATLVIINVCGFSLMPTSLMSLRMSYDTLNNSVVLFYIIVISFVTTIIMLTINLVGRKCI
jgi:spore maturation protein A